jgi:hypothetical protein
VLAKTVRQNIMDYKLVCGLIERLNVSPINGSELFLFLNRLKNKSDDLSNSNAQDNPATAKLINDADQEIMSRLKRLQIIALTKPILALCAQVQTSQDLNKAKNAGIDSIIELPSHISAKLNSLETTLEESEKKNTETKETDAEELCKKFNLVVPPSGLEASVVLTLSCAAITMLAFVIFKAENMLDSSEAYWGFLTAGILILLGINATIINLIKLLKFKKNRGSIVAEAKRKYLEDVDLKHSRLKKRIDDDCFQIQKIEYSKAVALKYQEIEEEEKAIRQSLNT